MMMMMMMILEDFCAERTDVYVETVAELHMCKQLSSFNAFYKNRRECRCSARQYSTVVSLYLRNRRTHNENKTFCGCSFTYGRKPR